MGTYKFEYYMNRLHNRAGEGREEKFGEDVYELYKNPYRCSSPCRKYVKIRGREAKPSRGNKSRMVIIREREKFIQEI
jgi:hypothetical protein